MYARWCLLLAFLLQAGCVTLVEPLTDEAGDVAERRPNIVFILADDLGIGDTGVYGSDTIATPNIDALAGGGVRFTNGYVTHPVCSPSRAGLITGRYQQRHGWEFNPAGRDVDSGMDVRETTLADALQKLGYSTGMVGKWHLGFRGDHHPLQRGFEEFYGVLAGGSIFIDSEADGVESVGRRVSKRSAYNSIYRDHERVEVTDYLTDVFTNEAVDFIERHQGAPFFLYLSHTTPHTPLQATRRYLDRYRHIENPAERIYSAMVSSLDDSVGALVSKLKQVGEYDNTLIVFLSDNGCAGYIGVCSNAPHSGFKRYHQEGGIRVPYIISWPDSLPAGHVYEHPVISLDLMATLTAAGGSEATTEDSVNLLPFISSRTLTNLVPHEYLYWRSGPTAAVRHGQWKLINYQKSVYTADDLGRDGRLVPPASGWPNAAPAGMITLLYDLANDPAEQVNLAGKHPEIVEQLKGAHDGWAAELREKPILPGFRSTLADMHGETVQLVF
jgi:arylsulfatase A-like enzyme